MRVPSVGLSGHKFSEVPRAEIQRSKLPRNHGYKTTFDGGNLIPVLVDEVLPGDTINCRMTAFARLATPLKPIMDNMTMDSFFFFVPNRLLWENWERFCGAQDDPADSTDFVIPQANVPVGGYGVGSLADYMGLPVGQTGFTHSALWFRAYNQIWNAWFRDQNLQDSIDKVINNGPDTGSIYSVRRRGKRHDYFSACLPWPQKGDSIQLPLGTSAPVTPTGDGRPTFSGDFGFGGTAGSSRLTEQAGSGNTGWNPGGIATQWVSWLDPHLVADLSGASAATVNQLRQAFQLQKLLERDARGGTRYTEKIRAHFNVTSPDARLQRPEYLGGGSSPVIVSPIAQTSEDGTTPQGNLAAIGTVSASGHGFVKSFTEHGVLIGLVCVRADLTYQDGLERMWSRSTVNDFYWPALAHIGEQAVLQKEIWCKTASAADNDDVFGYQERFAEYRYKPSRVTGLFRSDVAGTLDVWHLAQEFGGVPLLNASFIEEQPPIDRIIAVPAEPHFLFDAFFSYVCARPMPVYGVPGLIDHF